MLIFPDFHSILQPVYYRSFPSKIIIHKPNFTEIIVYSTLN